MDYWERVLQEVLHKDDESFPCVFTNIDSYRAKKPANKLKLKKRKRKMYLLGDDYPEVYFTQREAQCLYYVLKGLTARAIAKELNLSPRTIEYYVKMMRAKIGAKNKKELIVKMANSKIVEELNIND